MTTAADYKVGDKVRYEVNKHGWPRWCAGTDDGDGIGEFHIGTVCAVVEDKIKVELHVILQNGNFWDVYGPGFKFFKKVEDDQPESDPVNRPAHYTFSSIEVIDAIEAWQLGYHAGNVVKYVVRAAHKGKELEDLKKARWYLNRLIEGKEND